MRDNSELKWCCFGSSLVVQWLGLSAFTAGAPGSIPGQGTAILQAMRRSQKKQILFKKKKNKMVLFWIIRSCVLDKSLINEQWNSIPISGIGLLWMNHFDLKYKNTPLCSDCSLTVARSDSILCLVCTGCWKKPTLTWWLHVYSTLQSTNVSHSFSHLIL